MFSDLSVKNLNGSPKFRGVTACCVNENPYGDNPFSVQVNFGIIKLLHHLDHSKQPKIIIILGMSWQKASAGCDQHH
jgi:hypothetical protein